MILYSYSNKFSISFLFGNIYISNFIFNLAHLLLSKSKRSFKGSSGNRVKFKTFVESRPGSVIRKDLVNVFYLESGKIH